MSRKHNLTSDWLTRGGGRRSSRHFGNLARTSLRYCINGGFLPGGNVDLKEICGNEKSGILTEFSMDLSRSRKCSKRQIQRAARVAIDC